MNPSWLNSTVKCDVIKKLVRLWDFRGVMKERLQKACLPKISIPGQIVFEILFQHKIKYRVKFRRICVESLEQNGTSINETILLAAKDFLPDETSLAERSNEKRLYSQATICPTLLLLDKWAFQMLFFQNIPTNSKFHKFNFYDVITQELYNRSSSTFTLLINWLKELLRMSLTGSIRRSAFSFISYGIRIALAGIRIPA